MIDIDNTMARDEAAKPSRRHRPRGGRKNRKGSRDEGEPSKKLFDPDSGELFDPEADMDPDAASASPTAGPLAFPPSAAVPSTAASAEAAPSGMDEAMRRAESLYKDNPFGQLTNAHPES